MDRYPRDVLMEYARLNPDRAVRMLAHWEAFPLECFSLLHVDRAANTVIALRELLRSIGRLRSRPADWTDPFAAREIALGKRQRQFDHWQQGKAAVLAKKAKLEKQLERLEAAEQAFANASPMDDLPMTHAIMRGMGAADGKITLGRPSTRPSVRNPFPSAKTLKRRAQRKKYLLNSRTERERSLRCANPGLIANFELNRARHNLMRNCVDSPKALAGSRLAVDQPMEEPAEPCGPAPSKGPEMVAPQSDEEIVLVIGPEDEFSDEEPLPVPAIPRSEKSPIKKSHKRKKRGKNSNMWRPVSPSPREGASSWIDMTEEEVYQAFQRAKRRDETPHPSEGSRTQHSRRN